MKEEENPLFEDIQLKLLNPILKIKNSAVDNTHMQIDKVGLSVSSISFQQANFSKTSGYSNNLITNLLLNINRLDENLEGGDGWLEDAETDLKF